MRDSHFNQKLRDSNKNAKHDHEHNVPTSANLELWKQYFTHVIGVTLAAVGKHAFNRTLKAMMEDEAFGFHMKKTTSQEDVKRILKSELITNMIKGGDRREIDEVMALVYKWGYYPTLQAGSDEHFVAAIEECNNRDRVR